jgi:hypothetical protein
MAVRRALTIIDGHICRLPETDTLAGVSSSADLSTHNTADNAHQTLLGDVKNANFVLTLITAMTPP